jgi:hypothetical protein
MSASRGRRPSCTARRTIIAVTGLLMEAAWNSVVATTGRPVSTSAVPKPFTQWISKSLMTATLTPGTRYFCMTSYRVYGSRPCRLGDCLPSIRAINAALESRSGSVLIAAGPWLDPPNARGEQPQRANASQRSAPL